jgi:molybdopterin-containing oxidoreductase family iron-sulfur binding subunit
VHFEQGLNAMVYNRCIGTRYCSNNCPYKVRRFNYFNFTKDTPRSLELAFNPDVTVRSRGVMEKCTYCVQRINQGRIESKLSGQPLTDGDVRTACQQACPAEAIEFGDISQKSSRITQAKLNPRNYVLLEELYTKPRTTFLAKLRNPHPDLAGQTEVTAADAEEHL